MKRNNVASRSFCVHLCKSVDWFKTVGWPGIIVGLLAGWWIFYQPVIAQAEPHLACGTASPGDVVTVQGEAFTPGAVLHQFRWDDVVIPFSPGGLTVGNDGRFTLQFTAPADTYALHTLVALDAGGGQGECYLNLTPSQPTPTRTPTPTLTPTPTPTPTPGPPPGLPVPPTPVPGPGDYCAVINAALTPHNPLVGSTITAGLDISNNNIAWGSGQVQIGVWQYHQSIETDTGVRGDVPALVGGVHTTMPLSFQEHESGSIWYQFRLIDTAGGAVSGCVSDWFPLVVHTGEPVSPALLAPANNVWLNTRQVSLDWAEAQVPAGAGSVTQYEVQLREAGGGDLLVRTTGNSAANHTLTTDYGVNKLAWRARAQNTSGWGEWASLFYFGVDTVAPVVNIEVQGTSGDNGWYRSQIAVRLTGSDPAPGSGLTAGFLQPGRAKWQQVVPGAWLEVVQEGEISLRAYGRDDALNLSAVVVEPVKLDWTPPEQVSLSFSGSEATSSGWYAGPVQGSVEAQDSVSGIADRLVRIDGGSWQASPVTVAENGSHTVEYMTRDLAGNENAMESEIVKLDLNAPSGALNLGAGMCQSCGPVTVTVTVADAESGVGHWALTVTEPGQVGERVLTSGSSSRDVTLDGSSFPVGTLTLRLTVEDEVGHVSTREMDIINGANEPGPTPTPYIPAATATLWPTPPANGSTATPVTTSTPGSGDPGDGNDDDDGDDDGDGGGGGGDGPGNYPVGGQVVPVVLPVTGAPAGGLLLLMLIFTGIGLFAWFSWPGHRPIEWK